MDASSIVFLHTFSNKSIFHAHNGQKHSISRKPTHFHPREMYEISGQSHLQIFNSFHIRNTHSYCFIIYLLIIPSFFIVYDFRKVNRFTLLNDTGNKSIKYFYSPEKKNVTEKRYTKYKV